jgi:hypothetical protein
MKSTQTTKTIKKTSISRQGGANSGIGSDNRTITTKTTRVVDLGKGAPQPGLRRSSRGSRVWKKTILGEKFEFAEKLKEKKNYILYVSGMGHEKKQIEEIEETKKVELPKEKVVEVRQIIDNYGYHETKNVKTKNPKRLSITHHERLSTPFERTTLKKFSSYTTDPKARGYVSTSVQKTRYDTEPTVKTTTINQYNSMTSKQQKNKTIVPPKLYETYKPAKTQITKTTRTIKTENKTPNNISQTRNKITNQTQITKTKTEITKYGDRRGNQNIQNIQTNKMKIENKYKRPSPADLGINQTKTETHQDGEYIIKVTTTRTQIGKYGKPEERSRGGSVPRFLGPHGPHGPMPRISGFERSRIEIEEERQERRKSFERPHGYMGPHGPHGFMGPHGPMPHGPQGFMEPHGPMPHGPMPHGPHGYIGPHGPMPHGPMPHGFMGPHGPSPHGFMRPMPHGPHEFVEPHGRPMPHGYMEPHGPIPHGPHGFMGQREDKYPRREKMLTEGNVIEERKDNIAGISQYRFQQTTSRSEDGDNYEYFESKHVVKKGRVYQPITIHRYRGEIGGNEISTTNQDNRSSSYNKKITSTTQTITRNNKIEPKIESKTYQNIRRVDGKDGAGMITTKYTQKTTTIQNINKEERKGAEGLNEYRKYSQKGKMDASASSSSKYEMKQTMTETKNQIENDALYKAFAQGEFEYVFCPVHGKQLVRKKKFRKLQ